MNPCLCGAYDCRHCHPDQPSRRDPDEQADLDYERDRDEEKE